MNRSLTPKQVAQAIGVSEASLKRWCDQGLVPTVRTAGGHRRLPLEGVIQYLRSSGRALEKPEVLGLPSLTGQGDALMSRASESLQSALESGDDDVFRRHVLNLYLSGKSACEISDQALTPAMRGIGERWEHGIVNVYQERRACEMCARVLNELRALLPTLPDSAPLAIGGTLAGDQYLIATRIAELVLRESGWNAQNLGSNLPGESVCAAIKTVKPRLVWLSVSHIADAAAFLREYELVCKAAKAARVTIAIGGNALDATIRERMHYTAFCETFAHLISFAGSLKKVPSAKRVPSAE